MTTAAPAKTNKSTKATRRPTCQHCKTRFRTTSATALYCTRACKDKATALARRVKYVDKASNSAFFKQLAFEASRAKTLEIFTGLDAESLAELYKLYAFKLKANQYGKSKDFELSHIAPSQGEDDIGLYHPLNLVVAPTAMNRAHSNNHFGGGLSINRNKLKSRHTVERGDKQSTTIARIIAFIGADVVAEAVKIAGIKPMERSTTLAWLRDHLNPADPQHRAWLENLDDMQTLALKGLKSTLQGKEGSGYTIKTVTLTPSDVFILELERHAQQRPELTEVLDVLCKRVSPFTAFHQSRTSLNEEELQAVFDVLHGKSVESIRPVLTEYVERSISAKDHAHPITGAEQRIPPYMPIVLKPKVSVVSDPGPVAPKVLAVASLSLAVFKDFADELDAFDVQDIRPVLLPMHTATYEFDPLPWG